MSPAMTKYCRTCKCDLTGLDRPKGATGNICKTCFRDYQRTYREANAEKIKLRTKRWLAANSERVKVNQREWRASNIEKARQYGREWASRNPESRRAWADTNRDKVREYNANFARQNPHCSRNNASIRRNRKRKQTPSDFDPMAYEAKVALRDLLTSICGEPFELDHIVPIAKGGAHHQDNIQVVPAWVNRRKHLAVEYWYSDQFLISVIENRNPFTS